jgi:hypothetical protein
MDTLDDLDSLISHLTANPLPHTLLALDTIQQAKLQSLISYTLYDLVFSPLPLSPRGLSLTFSQVYLKSNGVDPKSHPVVAELVSHLIQMRPELTHPRTGYANISKRLPPQRTPRRVRHTSSITHLPPYLPSPP